MAVAVATGGGNFTPSNDFSMGTFATMASTPHAQPVSGDFNGDGKGDIALVGGDGWNSIPVAFSSGNGSFVSPPANVTTTDSTTFEADFHSDPTNVKAVAGDFNGDGFDDIALTGPSWWTTIPIAFSNGDGTFHVTNGAPDDAGFPGFAGTSGVFVVAGDQTPELLCHR